MIDSVPAVSRMGFLCATLVIGYSFISLAYTPSIAADRRPFYEYQAEIVPHGTQQAAFQISRVERPTLQGGSEIDVTFLNQKGEVAMTEHAILGKQAEVLDYSFEQKQLGHRGSVQRIAAEGTKKEHLRIAFTAVGKPTVVTQEAPAENLIVGTSLMPYIFKHRQELLDGAELNVRLAVPERQDTYGFSIRHRGRDEWQGKEVARIEMRPTSFIIRQLVDAMSFYMDLEVKTLVGYRGRMGVYMQKPGSTSWDPFSGITRYKTPLTADAMLQASGAGIVPPKNPSRPE